MADTDTYPWPGASNSITIDNTGIVANSFIGREEPYVTNDPPSGFPFMRLTKECHHREAEKFAEPLDELRINVARWLRRN